mmetsp:Transcript_4774/g.8053  ORF Transcript_4774/g.8053 Transcript_4774/m.8053 type:complete len:225 (+) Transcript_4774:772-1446(+)
MHQHPTGRHYSVGFTSEGVADVESGQVMQARAGRIHVHGDIDKVQAFNDAQRGESKACKAQTTVRRGRCGACGSVRDGFACCIQQRSLGSNRQARTDNVSPTAAAGLCSAMRHCVLAIQMHRHGLASSVVHTHHHFGLFAYTHLSLWGEALVADGPVGGVHRRHRTRLCIRAVFQIREIATVITELTHTGAPFDLGKAWRFAGQIAKFGEHEGKRTALAGLQQL